MADSDSDEYHSADEDGGAYDGRTRTKDAINIPHVETELARTLENTRLDDGSARTSQSPVDNKKKDEDATGNSGASGFVSNLDNRYISEGTDDIKGEKVELTEEQIKELKEQANKLKGLGNESFKNDDLESAVQHYTEAIKLYSSECKEELAICYANRAACNIKLEKHEDVVEDCSKALELRPGYLKAVMRRAQSNERLDKLEEALQDYTKALELDPTQHQARQAVARLPEQIKEQQEKMKAEMIGKLKELGDTVLKPFGLSTNNFQLQQDPNTGGYSINFKR